MPDQEQRGRASDRGSRGQWVWHRRDVDVTVRFAVAADAPVIARIYVESWNDGFGDLLGIRTYDDGLVARWVGELTGGPQRWWVGLRAGQIVGFVGVGPSRDPVEPDVGELDTIALAPSDWRIGIGRTLMAVALRSLADDFLGAVVWSAAGYERGLRFYEATGWVPTDRTRADGREVCLWHRLRQGTYPPPR
jgi:GNAT superfamily N-acetyltransferase